MREPAIAWYPGKIQPGQVSCAVSCTMDLFPTLLTLAGVPIPTDRIIDGRDLSPVLFENSEQHHDVFFYYRGTTLMAVRKGPWKAHFITQLGYAPGKPNPPIPHDPPLLYHLEHDPSEQYDCAAKHKDVIAEIKQVVKEHKAKLKAGKNMLEEIVSPQ